jgi:hypothetical protein
MVAALVTQHEVMSIRVFVGWHRKGDQSIRNALASL